MAIDSGSKGPGFESRRFLFVSDLFNSFCSFSFSSRKGSFFVCSFVSLSHFVCSFVHGGPGFDPMVMTMISLLIINNNNC